MSEPTQQDKENAVHRQIIAERQNAEYARCVAISVKKLGQGWKPWMKLSLFREEDCRPKGKDDAAPVPVAVAFKVFRGAGDGKRVRYLREMKTGEILVSERYEDVFGSLLEELHPDKTIAVRGEKVPTRKYQLYWSAVELYEPKSPGQLAALRQSRQKGKAVREQRKFAEENPLLAQAGIKPEDVIREDRERGR